MTWSAVHAPGLDFTKGVFLENSAMAYQAAQLGVGIAMTHNPAFFADELALGQMIAPLGPAATVATGNAYFMVRPKRRTLRGPVRILWDWLKSAPI